jgi:peptide deformylase
MSSEQRKKAMKEIRESQWFGMATELGNKPVVKISPHKTLGLGL